MKNKFLKYVVFPPLLQSSIYFITRLFEGKPYNVSLNIDSKIPFISYFVIFYVLWYIFLIVSPLIIYKRDEKSLKEYALTYVVCAIISSILFLFFPTTVTRASSLNDNLFFDKLVILIYKNDSPALNCFPSFHCLACILWIKYIGLNRNIKKYIRILITFFSIVVMLSTLFIKQHAVVDVIGSLFVFIIGYNISKIILGNKK